MEPHIDEHLHTALPKRLDVAEPDIVEAIAGGADLDTLQATLRCGTSCGSCHIAFDPLNPPADPARPKWENIKGLVGNQYTRMSELLGSGMSKSALEYQMFAHARPGVTDTSAISHDQVNNPGTINALINVAQRPVFKGEAVSKWRKVASCAAGQDEAKCWCEPGRDGKCWQFSTRTDDVTPVFLGGTKVNLPGIHHILKGGEDSTGAHEAFQRVYFNIGSCAEQCWVNHFTDMRQVDPQQRGFGQTPFNVGQCRRDCPSFRAVEDRLQNILDFFASAESDQTDLAAARANGRRGAAYGRAELVADPGHLLKVLHEGNDKANAMAVDTLGDVLAAMQMDY